MAPNTGPATYIADKTDKWEGIAQWSDLDVDELKKLNEAKGRLKSGQIVRLRPTDD